MHSLEMLCFHLKWDVHDDAGRDDNADADDDAEMLLMLRC